MNPVLLFVPGGAPGMFTKARASEAGSLILDLEDSVAASAKDDARRNVIQMLAAPPSAQTLWVRVNSLASGLMLTDLAAVVKERPFGIVLPKCDGLQTLQKVSHYLDAFEATAGIAPGTTKILAIATETAGSMFRLGEYAGVTDRLWGLTWGAEDLSADIGAIDNRENGAYTEPFRLARSMALFSASAASVRPIDTVCVSLKEADLVQRESAEAFRDGFVAKMAIHPAQIAPIIAGFTCKPEQIDWARRVIAALAAKPEAGAVQVDGKMIDVPHLKLARRFLESSE